MRNYEVTTKTQTHKDNTFSLLLGAFVFSWLALLSTTCWSVVFAAEPPITAIAFTPDGEQLVVGSQAGVEVRSWPELKPLRKLATKLPYVRDLVFSPDGKTLAIAGGAPGDWGDIELHVWNDQQAAAAPLRCDKKASDAIVSIAWSHDGRRLLAASDDKLVRIYDQQLHASRLFVGHSRPVTAVAWIPGDEQFVSAGDDQSLRVWKTEGDAAPRTLDQHTGAVLGLAIEPNRGQQPAWIATCSADKTVRFWQPTIGRMVRFAKLPAVPQAVRWLPDGSRLVVVSREGKLRVIAPDTAEIHQTSPAIEGWPYALAIHPSGKSAVVGGERGELRGVALLKSDEDER